MAPIRVESGGFSQVSTSKETHISVPNTGHSVLWNGDVIGIASVYEGEQPKAVFPLEREGQSAIYNTGVEIPAIEKGEEPTMVFLAG